MDKLFIVTPAYNEEGNIEKVIREWYPHLQGKDEDSRLVVADSGSNDQTHAILQKLRRDMPKLEILSDTKKQHGPKLIALYNYAIEKNADYIFQTDSDGQTDPAEFQDFWIARSQWDIVCGNRQRGGAERRSNQNIC